MDSKATTSSVQSNPVADLVGLETTKESINELSVVDLVPPQNLTHQDGASTKESTPVDTDLSVADLVPPSTPPLPGQDDTTKDTRSTPTPPMVKADTKSGVEPQALVLAKLFMVKMGGLARKCSTRGQLSELYLATIASWATKEVQEDLGKQRHFKQVLFAIAHGMKLVRVKDQGRSLFWNRYRDNYGNPLEEERVQFDQRRRQWTDDGARTPTNGGWQTAGRRYNRDDRQGGQRYNRDHRQGGGHHYNRDDRQGGGHRYNRDDRQGGHKNQPPPSMTIACPADAVGWVIGSGGRGLKAITETAGNYSRINFNRDTKLFEITAKTHAACEVAKSSIEQRIKDFRPRADGFRQRDSSDQAKKGVPLFDRWLDSQDHP